MTSPAGAGSAPSSDLSGKRVLIVEDEFYVADEMARDFEGLGAEVVGPVASLVAAREAIADGGRLDGAVLDINLLGERVFPLVDALRERGVACVFATGYDRQAVPAIYQGVPLCQKPVDTAKIARALFGQERSSRPS